MGAERGERCAKTELAEYGGGNFSFSFCFKQSCVFVTEMDALNGDKRVNCDLLLNGEWSRQIER